MRTIGRLYHWAGLFLYLLFGQEVVAQNFNFSSNTFISFSPGNANGMTFCMDSSANVHIYDENGVLLSSLYLPGPGCVSMLFDSAILANSCGYWQLDKNRLIIQMDVKGVVYNTSSQLLYAQDTSSGVVHYPNTYSMELLPPPSMAGTANIKVGYNIMSGLSSFPYSFQVYSYCFQAIGISDTSRFHIFPGGYHPLLNGQSSYSVEISSDDIWLDYIGFGSFSPIFPQYYPSSIIEQDSSQLMKGKFITCTGGGMNNGGILNSWAYYNARLLFFPLAYEFLGTSYHTIPHATRLGDSLMAFSFHDGTILNVNGNIDTLAKGEIYRALIDTPSTWSANYPFSLVQISRQSAQDSVFQSAMFAYSVHPDEALLTYTWYPSEIIDDTIPNQQSYLNLLSPTNGVSTVKLDGNALAGFFHPYPNDPGWSWAQVPVASSVHKLEADSGVIAYAYQYGESCGAGFNVGGLRMKNSGTTSQPEMNERNEINLHPNPAKNVIHITNLKSNQKELKASVWDMDGRMVMEEQLLRANFSLDIGSLKPGMYILKIQLTSERETHVLRFVKIP